MKDITVKTLEQAGPTQMAGGGLEGADRLSQTLLSWQPAVISPSAMVAAGKDMADARTQDAVQNSGMAQGAVAIHRDSIVGSQFNLNAKPNALVLGVSEEWAEMWQEQVESRFNLVADSPSCWFDAERKKTLTGLVRMAVGSFLLAGEAIATAEWVRDRRRPFNTAVQMISSHRLSNPDGESDTDRRKSGIDMDEYGAPWRYWIRTSFPGDMTETEGWKWKPVLARKAWGRRQVIHIMEQLLPSQPRGISEMVASLKDFHMTKKFSDVTLQNAVVNASYAAVIESELPTDMIYQAMGGGADQSPLAGYLSTYMDGLAAYMAASKNIAVDGVKAPVLFPGTKYKAQALGTPGGVGTDFEASMLRKIAASLGLSYEQFSRDYTQTNYSSARASMAETWKFMQSRKKIVADAFATEIYTLWLEEEVARGNIPMPPGYTPDDFYDPMVREALTCCTWIGASRGQIDEKKETEAAVLRLDNQLTTLEDECARLGLDWRQIIRQRSREQKMMKQYGLEPAAKKEAAGPSSQEQDEEPTE